MQIHFDYKQENVNNFISMQLGIRWNVCIMQGDIAQQ